MDPTSTALSMARDERQPGRRAPAPGELALVQSFVNSRWDLDRGHEDRLGSPPELARWLVERELLEPGTTLTERDLRRVLDIREGLRALLFANNDLPSDEAAIERLNRGLRDAALKVQLARVRPPALLPERGGIAGAMATLARIVVQAQIDGSWQRLKACGGRNCGWAFYDQSRNQSASWCSMATCGSRTKARQYRRRKRSERT